MSNNVQIFRTMALTLNDADFEEAFQLMCDERNTRRDKRMLTNKNALHKGSIVEWSGTKSGSCTGEVVKVKTKKAIVKQTSKGRHIGTNWDIPMSMLKVVG
jgi:hypothetical protein